MTVAVPTLAADETLACCLASLAGQTFSDFEVVVIDNSGRGAARAEAPAKVISNDRNVGFGAAVNQAFRQSSAPYFAVLNDDAVADRDWLARLVAAIQARPDAGMCASQVRLAGSDALDSAGMLLCGDGSSKQRGHGEPAAAYACTEEALLPSGSAALYRREMLEEIGLFDESFFLYCEDTDLGLRGRWAGWKCLYVPDAIVEHRYSHSSGRASALKAYYVERNRLYVIFKNFPVAELLRVPFYAMTRYFWHFLYALGGRGKAAEFSSDGGSVFRLPWYVVRGHLALLARLPVIWRERRGMKRRLTAKQFRRLIRRHSISPRRVASL
ncbi:MAG TPA: glycosyltransferase family 2 protein [Bryobacteraceae bacterium]|nr:glycosyltransferase family 2 protein [Bryobacteraceae bacterium]